MTLPSHKKMPPPVRKKTADTTLKLRISSDTKERANFLADRAQLSVSEYMRHLILVELKQWKNEGQKITLETVDKSTATKGGILQVRLSQTMKGDFLQMCQENGLKASELLRYFIDRAYHQEQQQDRERGEVTEFLIPVDKDLIKNLKELAGEENLTLTELLDKLLLQALEQHRKP